MKLRGKNRYLYLNKKGGRYFLITYKYFSYSNSPFIIDVCHWNLDFECYFLKRNINNSHITGK